MYSVPRLLRGVAFVVGGLDRLVRHLLGRDLLGRLHGDQRALLVLEHQLADAGEFVALTAKKFLLDQLVEDAVEQRLGRERLVLLRKARAEDEHVADGDVRPVDGRHDRVGGDGGRCGLSFGRRCGGASVCAASGNAKARQIVPRRAALVMRCMDGPSLMPREPARR